MGSVHEVKVDLPTQAMLGPWGEYPTMQSQKKEPMVFTQAPLGHRPMSVLHSSISERGKKQERIVSIANERLNPVRVFMSYGSGLYVGRKETWGREEGGGRREEGDWKCICG